MRGIWRRIVETLRAGFVAGLLVIVPIGFTLLAVAWIIDRLDNLVLPQVFRFLGMEAQQPPFVGLIVTLCVIFLGGVLTRSFVGRWALRIWEHAIDRVPIARSLYAVLKQFMEAVFTEKRLDGFKRVVLIQYPRPGIWSYAFVTGRVSQTIPGIPCVPGDLVKVFVPSTPNPTTGYFLILPAADTLDTGLSVEEAFKLIISAGIATGTGEVRLGPREPQPAAAADAGLRPVPEPQ